MKLLYDKTVVYATHQLEFLEAADLILVSDTELILCRHRKFLNLFD